jgi:hypothetical protein
MPNNECEVPQEQPGHIAAKQHAPYDEKPAVQVVNETLSADHPTGYVPANACFDLDKAQLESQAPTDTDAYREAKQRVENDEKFYHKSSGIDGDAGAWTEAGRNAEGFPVAKGSPEDVTSNPSEREYPSDQDGVNVPPVVE